MSEESVDPYNRLGYSIYYDVEQWRLGPATGTTDTVGTKRGFHYADYIIFAVLLASSLGIGLFYAIRGQSTTSEYLMGGRNLNVIPTSVSIFMSFMSAILVLGNTAEMYQWGAQMMLRVIGNGLAFIVTAVIWVPLFWPLNVTSAFEYLERRYRKRAVKIIATVLLILSQIIYMGIAVFAPATALEAVTGFPMWGTILAVSGVGTVYTVIGGMKAVIWTDLVQGFIFLCGVIVILALGSAKVGGMKNVFDIAQQTGRINLWNPDPDPTGSRVSFFSMIVGSFMGYMQLSGTSQTSVQRYSAVSSLSKARLTVLLNLPIMLVLNTVTCMLGLTVYAYYHQQGCDPLKAGIINNANQLLPQFVMDVAGYPGIPGLFLAVLCSGALSSLSSSLGGLSAVVWKMIEWNDNVRLNMPEHKKAMITKLIALGFGLLGIGMAFLARVLGTHVLQASQSFTGGVAGPLMGMYMLGAFFPWANWIGAVVGAFVGLVLTLWVAIGARVHRPYSSPFNNTIENCWAPVNSTWPTTDWTAGTLSTTDLVSTPSTLSPADPPTYQFYRMSYLWYSSIGVGTTVVVGLIVSLITGPMDPRCHDPKLIIPFFDRIFCWIPLGVRRKCWCGVNHDEAPSHKVAPIDEAELVEMVVVNNGAAPKDSNDATNDKPSPVREHGSADQQLPTNTPASNNEQPSAAKQQLELVASGTQSPSHNTDGNDKDTASNVRLATAKLEGSGHP